MRHCPWPRCGMLLLCITLLLPASLIAAEPTPSDSLRPRTVTIDPPPGMGGPRIIPIDAPHDTVRVPVRMLLSWHAPYGQPRASAQLTYAAGDTASNDTLYVSFDPMTDHAKFVGYMATLYLRPVEGDTLGRFWQYVSGSGQRPIARVELADSTYPGVPPWGVQAAGGARYDHTRTSAQLKLLAAVNHLDDTPIRGGTLYTLARIILRRPDGRDAQEMKPLCIELASLLLTFTMHKEDEQLHRSGEQRFVAYRDPKRAACGDALPHDKPARAGKSHGR